MTTPVLSICVPSRNRQRYFQETIRFLLENPRDDVEYVLADNSDDPAVMNDFMAGISDRRIRYLPSVNRVLSMQENWERSLSATTGAWVSVIGDDDLIDPDLVDALMTAQALKPGMEAFGWSILKYTWVSPGDGPHNIRVPLSGTFHDMPQPLLFRRAFRWDDAGSTLTSGYSVYHSAISRGLLNRTKLRFGNRHFEHPTIDYDNALKNVALGKGFVYCQRPFSIFGACAESNSAAVWNPKLMEEAHQRFMRELGRTYDQDDWMEGFPFHSMLGLPAIVAQVQQFLRVRHGLGMAGWEANFARACASYCSAMTVAEDFAALTEAHRAIFASWKGGAYLSHFQPVYAPRPEGEIYTGLIDRNLYLADTIGGATTPSEFYRVIRDLLQKPADLAPELRDATQDSAVIARIEPLRRSA